MDKIWISWENHRRTIELAKAINVRLYVLLSKSTDIKPRMLRYLYLSFKTFNILLKTRPKIVFIQNPSIFLAVQIAFLKRIFNYKIVVDRHSNFKLQYNLNLKWKLFHALSDYTIRKSELTIVTNNFLAELVNKKGGNSFILEDKLPFFSKTGKISLKGHTNITYVSSFSNDEPTSDVIRAAELIDGNIVIYITGNYEKYFKKSTSISFLPNNIVMTGFINDEDYQKLICSSDIVMVLTKQEYTLTCGAYEGVVLNKPLILSNTNTVKNYFSKGAVYTNPTFNEIADAIHKAIREKEDLTKKIIELKDELSNEWARKFNSFLKIIDGLYKIDTL